MYIWIGGARNESAHFITGADFPLALNAAISRFGFVPVDKRPGCAC